MSLLASPFGLLLRNHPSGQSRANVYTITYSYATAIGYGDPVLLNTDGTLNIAGTTGAIIGVFAGVEYNDATGKPTFSKNWTGATAGATNIKAYVYDDPDNVFEIQVGTTGDTNSSWVAAALGAQGNMATLGTPNAATGHSTSYLSTTIVAASSQGQFRVVGFGADGIYVAGTNPFPTVLVKIAQHQYVADKVAI